MRVVSVLAIALLQSDLVLSIDYREVAESKGYKVHALHEGSLQQNDIILRNPETEEIMCLSRLGSYPLTAVKPVCKDPRYEHHHRSCLKKCTLLTNGNYPIRTGATACAQKGCDNLTEDSWGNQCLAKCSVLTNGKFPRRRTSRICAVESSDWDCKWYEFYKCLSYHSPRRGDLKGPAYNYMRYNIRPWYGETGSEPEVKCGSDDVLYERKCYPKVQCVTVAPEVAESAPTEPPTEAPEEPKTEEGTTEDLPAEEDTTENLPAEEGINEEMLNEEVLNEDLPAKEGTAEEYIILNEEISEEANDKDATEDEFVTESLIEPSLEAPALEDQTDVIELEEQPIKEPIEDLSESEPAAEPIIEDISESLTSPSMVEEVSSTDDNRIIIVQDDFSAQIHK